MKKIIKSLLILGAMFATSFVASLVFGITDPSFHFLIGIPFGIPLSLVWMAH